VRPGLPDNYKEREAEILRDPARQARIAGQAAAILAANRRARLREQAGMTQATSPACSA
jgi:hypothetical protein